MGVSGDLPSGYVKIAIEHGHVFREFSHSNWWFSIAMLVYQRLMGFNGIFHGINTIWLFVT